MATKPAPTEDAINPHLLPKGLRELVRVLGFATAIRLVQRRGGRSLIVPKRVDFANPTPAALALLDDLGSAQALAALVDWAGGATIDYLPKYDAVARQLRHEQVRQMARAGKSPNQIAHESQYSVRWVFEILGLDKDERQHDLFAHVPAVDEPVTSRASSSAGFAHNPFGITAAHHASAAQDDDD